MIYCVEGLPTTCAATFPAQDPMLLSQAVLRQKIISWAAVAHAFTLSTQRGGLLLNLPQLGLQALATLINVGF